jgi:hypothetical protein
LRDEQVPVGLAQCVWMQWTLRGLLTQRDPAASLLPQSYTLVLQVSFWKHTLGIVCTNFVN